MIDAIAAILTRRSVRQFGTGDVPRAVLEALVEEACCAPSPHGTRPWRYALVTAAEAKPALADRMGWPRR